MRSTSYNDTTHSEETGWGMAFIGIVVALVVAYGAYAFYMSGQTSPIDMGAGTVVFNNDMQAQPATARE